MTSPIDSQQLRDSAVTTSKIAGTFSVVGTSPLPPTMLRGRHSGFPAREFEANQEPPPVRMEPRRRPRGRVWRLLYAARFISKWEGGPLLTAVLDTIASPPVPTVGFGHTGPGVFVGMTITRAKAMALLVKDIRFASRAVKRSIHVDLTFRQRIALISLVFNCGPGAVEGSQLQRKLNSGRYLAAANEFLEWSHAGGVLVQGLLNRRREERWIFLHPKKRSR